MRRAYLIRVRKGSTGSPGAGNDSILLADIGAHQTFELSVSVELSGSAENGGLVIAYIDNGNFWVLMGTAAGQEFQLYEVSGGTWNLRRNGGTYTLSCEVRSGWVEQLPGGMADYSATIPVGQVGVWAASGSASVKLDDFKLLSMNSMVDIDGRWWDDEGGTALARQRAGSSTQRRRESDRVVPLLWHRFPTGELEHLRDPQGLGPNGDSKPVPIYAVGRRRKKRKAKRK